MAHRGEWRRRLAAVTNLDPNNWTCPRQMVRSITGSGVRLLIEWTQRWPAVAELGRSAPEGGGG